MAMDNTLALPGSDWIVTERLVLRPVVKADLPAIVDGLGNRDVSKWLDGVPHPYGMAEAQDWFAKKPQFPSSCAITLGGRVIGTIRVQDTMGYWLRQDCWGMGFGSEAAAALVSHRFTHSDQPDIAAYYLNDNHGSAAVLRKLGFAPMSAARKAQAIADGASACDVFVVLTRDVWEGRQ